MDNLRSLSGSLPRAPPSGRHRSAKPSQQQIVEAFKAAARSVTELYRNATSDAAAAYADGYQDALADLLSFMDKENIGTGDGEGWRVRGWLAEHIEGPETAPEGVADDNGEREEESDEDKRPRSLSPGATTKPLDSVPIATQPLEKARANSPARSGSAPPSQNVPTAQHFTFTASQPFPAQDMELDASLGLSAAAQQSQQRTRVNFTGRPSRNNRASRMNQLNNRGLTTDSGIVSSPKRKLPFAEFFDASGLDITPMWSRREGSAGHVSKRARTSGQS